MDRYKNILSSFNKELSTKIGYPGSLMSALRGRLSEEEIEINYSEEKIISNVKIGIMPDSLAEILINNVGSPYKDSESYSIEVKDIERESIEILGRYLGLNENTSRGYIAAGGTEANLACIWWSRLWIMNKRILLLAKYTREREVYLDQNLPSSKDDNKNLRNYLEINKQIMDLSTPTIFCSANHTHYCIKKISDLMKLDINFVETHPGGEINLESLEEQLVIHVANSPNKGIIMVANIGTTITGAIDNAPGIKKVLDRITDNGRITPYTIHADAAFYGMIIPITKPFGEIKNYLEDLGINTMIISGHKFLGTTVLGLALTTESFLKESFIENDLISYCGNIDDITISGSRPGINILWLHNTLLQLGLGYSTKNIEKIINNNLKNAEYFYNELVKIVGAEKVFWNPGQFNVVFPRPSLFLVKKYKLMPALQDKAVACIQISVHKKLLNEFLAEYIQELQRNKKEEHE